MASHDSLQKVRKIDNTRKWLPILTTFLVIILFVIFYWFFRGGSFRLYASVFFTLYHFTGYIWISVILMGLLQSVIFLPLRFISLKFSTSLKSFEEELDLIKSDSEQYLLFSSKVKQGNPAIIFYILNFVVNAIAFISAGRIFLIDFYSKSLDPKLLYSIVPYPDYPLMGTDFNFPFFQIENTTALPWTTIASVWLIITLVFAVPRILWRLVKPILWKSKKILSARINYNRLLLSTGGFSLSFLIISIFVLRNIPTDLSFYWLIADLTRQNTTFNFVTAVGTFIVTLHAGYMGNSRASKNAIDSGIDPLKAQTIFRLKMRQSFKNALLLGAGAFFITNQIPCAFELSVVTYEVIYLISPYTFDRFLHHAHKSTSPTPLQAA
jgi:hypothetical protein